MLTPIAVVSLGICAYYLLGLALAPRLLDRLRAGAPDGCSCRWCRYARDEAHRMRRWEGDPKFLAITTMLLVGGWIVDLFMLVAQRATHVWNRT